MNLLQIKKLYLDEAYVPNEEEIRIIKTVHHELINEFCTKNKALALNAYTVRDLFWKKSFKEVFAFIVSKKWAEPEQEDMYASIYKTVLKQPVNRQINTFIVCEKDDDEESSPNVYSMELDNITHFAFDFVSYRELANYIVHPRCIEAYEDNIALIAGILEEFSWNPYEEDKEENLSSLNERASSAIEFFEKQKEKETIEASIDGIENAHSIWENVEEAEDEEDDVATYTFRKNEGFFLKDIFYNKSFNELREHFLTYCLEEYDEDLKVQESELSTLFSSAFFQIKKALTRTEVVDQKLFLEICSDYAYFYKNSSEENFSDVTCIVNGPQLIDFLGYKMTDRFGLLEEADIITYFMFAYLAPSLTFDANRTNFERDELAFLKRRLQDQKSMALIFENIENGMYTQYTDLSVDAIELLLQNTYPFIEDDGDE